MKITCRDRALLRMFRDLDVQQRDDFVKQLRIAVLANKVTMRVACITKIRLVTNRTVSKAFGPAPWWNACGYVKKARHG